METPDKVYYEDEDFLVTASRVLIKDSEQTFLIADIREPRVEQNPGCQVDVGGTILTRLQNWITGAKMFLRWDALLVRYRGRVEELASAPWHDGSPVFEKEYAATGHHSPAVRARCDRLRVVSAAIWAALADYAARHPEAYAAAWRADDGEQKPAHADGRAVPPTPSPEPPKQGGGGSGLGWLALVVLIIGGLFLYQREGGKVFDEKKKSDPIVPAVVYIKASLDPGFSCCVADRRTFATPPVRSRSQ